MNQINEFTAIDTRPGWLELCGRIRGQAGEMMNAETVPEGERVRTLARDVLELCAHVESMHKEMTSMLNALESASGVTADAKSKDHEIDIAAIEIQRETHELRADPLDILKALLMWRDDPAERLKRRV